MWIEYESNNSGGYWWLKDEDWLKLEEAGWEIEWGGLYFCRSSEGGTFSPPEGKPTPCLNAEDCPGHRKADSFEEAKETRYLGAVAKSAKKEFSSVKECLDEFERLTGQQVSDEGCNRCGAPHYFSWEDEEGHPQSCSGETCLGYLFNGPNLSLREAYEALRLGEAG